MPVTCPVIVVANGVVTYSSGQSVGSAASYTCNTNYQLNGTSPVTCLSTGNWSGAPTCVDICTVAGNHGTTTHCCDSTPCVTQAAPTCNTSTRNCGPTPSGGACTSGPNCATNNCVGGICCQSSCNGECWKDCAGPNGTCRPVLATDRKACGSPIIDTSTNHTAAAYPLCDGSGNCPTGLPIHCGGSPSFCTLDSTTACCNADDNYTSTAPVCIPRDSCFHHANQSSENCNDAADCPSGMVCCNVAGVGFWVNVCLSASDCATAMNSSVTCDGRTACTSGTCKKDLDYDFTTTVVQTCQ